MTDPAHEAAQRAWTERYGADQLSRFHEDCAEDENVAAFVVAAAREALAPLKELHKPCEPYLNDNPYDTDETITDCVECEVRWPCDTAALIYSDAELNPEGTTP